MKSKINWKKFLLSRTALLNFLIAIFALLEVQTQVLAGLIGAENVPLAGLLFAVIGLYLRSITSESVRSQDDKPNEP